MILSYYGYLKSISNTTPSLQPTINWHQTYHDGYGIPPTSRPARNEERGEGGERWSSLTSKLLGHKEMHVRKKRCSDACRMSAEWCLRYYIKVFAYIFVYESTISLIGRSIDSSCRAMDSEASSAQTRRLLLFRSDPPRRLVRTSRRQLVWKVVVGMDRARSWPAHRSRTAIQYTYITT